MKVGRRREQITQCRELEIIEVIDNWSLSNGKLSREALARTVCNGLNFQITRQGLMKREAIRKAYLRKELELSAGCAPRSDKEPLTVMLERRIEELLSLVADRDGDLARYKALFVTYHYNARHLGISTERLEQPIPSRHAS